MMETLFAILLLLANSLAGISRIDLRYFLSSKHSLWRYRQNMEKFAVHRELSTYGQGVRLHRYAFACIGSNDGNSDMDTREKIEGGFCKVVHSFSQ